MGALQKSSPSPEWFDAMAEAYRSAEFGRAAEIFDRVGAADVPYEAVLWRARILLKKNDSAQALRFLEDRLPPHANATGEAEREMLLGMAYGRLGQHAEAAEHFQSAARLAESAQLPESQSEIAYWRGRDFVLQGKLDLAEFELRATSLTRSLVARVRALDLQSLIEGRRKNHVMQAALLIELLEVQDRAPAGALPEFSIWAVHTLAGLAREMFIPQARQVLVKHLSLPWPSWFEQNRFQAEKALGWTCALEGDYFNAFRYLKAATATAPDQAWKTMALLDRAYLARAMGEFLWSRQELAEAEEVAERVDWRSATGEERIALLLLAELYATIDRGKASYYLTQFEQLDSLRDPLLNFSYDDRLRGLAEYVKGVVDVALGHRKQGLRSLRTSFDIFDSHGYDWRAGRAALRIQHLTGDPAMLDVAREKLRHYASSWLWRELLKQARTTESGLTPMQEAVFREVCQGRSTHEIAQRMRISEFTVRNHLRLVFKTFNVKSRTALLAEASRRGLMN